MRDPSDHTAEENHVYDLEREIDRLNKEIEKRNEVIQYCYDACLCERFHTYGFDYDETHPNPKIGNRGCGRRANTPKVFIDNVIGFDWEYEEPEGVCKSWKVLRLNANLTHSHSGSGE